ncbi:MAG: CBS domain-containing protein [Thermoplasmata archaeon]|nr:MAG: CBS domain-containing protein [Thermoplasmata archaeon]
MKEFYESKVRDVMHSHLWDLPLVEENTDIKTVLIILTSRGYVWVIDNRENMKIKGVITEHDILNLFEKFNENIRAGEFSTKKVISCSKEDKISDIIVKMKESNVRRLPVVEGERIVGEITLRHLIEKYYSLLP